VSETSEDATVALQKYFEEGSKAFFGMMQQRHMDGEAKYGRVKFMEVNTLEEALEELADLGNYAMYTFMKVWVLNRQLAAVTEAPDETTLGVQSFIPNVQGR